MLLRENFWDWSSLICNLVHSEHLILANAWIPYWTSDTRLQKKKIPGQKGGPGPPGSTPKPALVTKKRYRSYAQQRRGEVRQSQSCKAAWEKRAALLLSQCVLFSAASEHPAAGDVSLWTRPLAERPKRRGGIRGRLFSVTLACLLPAGSFWLSHFGFLVISFDSRHCRDAGLR